MIWPNHLFIWSNNSKKDMISIGTLIAVNGLSAINISTHIMCTVLFRSLLPMPSTFAHLCHATYIKFVSDLMSIYGFTFVLFSMGCKGRQHLKKYVLKPPRHGQSHQGQCLNQWYEDNMEAAILEYHRYTLQNMVLHCITVLWNTNRNTPKQGVTLKLHSKTYTLVDAVFVMVLLYSKGDPSTVSISALAAKYNILKTTLWKWITGKVIGKGHCSRGKGCPKVLSASE